MKTHKLLVFCIAIVLSAVFLGAAEMPPLDTLSRQPVPNWQWTVSEQGELKVTIADCNYTLLTNISYPNMPADGWNGIPGKPVTVAKAGNRATVTFTCDYYTLTRTIEPKDHRLTVRDTFKNNTNEDLAIAFDNFLMSHKHSEKDNIRVAGCYKAASPAAPSSPAQNSSIFFEDANGALAMVIEDDYYRLQATLTKKADCGIVKNRSFALPADASYTFEYSFYPTGQGDYWDFINRLRRDWNLNNCLDGNLVLATSPHTQLASTMPDVLKTVVRDYIGTKYISATNSTWFGQPSFYQVPNNRRFMKEYGSHETQVRKEKGGLAHAAELSPNFCVTAKIQTVFAGPPQLPGEPIPFEDSVIIGPSGKPEPRNALDEAKNVAGYVHLHYPSLCNSYYKYLIDLVNQALDAGVKAVYFDTFTYTIWTPYGRWTYDRWDGHTVDIDTNTWTIARKKADLAKLAEDAHVALNDLIRKRGAKMIYNGTLTTRKAMTAVPTTASFVETTSNQLPLSQHAGHPVNLGYYPGYTGKEWSQPRELFVNVMENLEYGCLTYIYWLTRHLPQSPTIYCQMFPITVKNIYAGCVEGEERIVTKRSGRYSFGTPQEPKIYFYDKDGIEGDIAPELVRFEKAEGKVIVNLTLPEGCAAILCRR